MFNFVYFLEIDKSLTSFRFKLPFRPRCRHYLTAAFFFGTLQHPLPPKLCFAPPAAYDCKFFPLLSDWCVPNTQQPTEKQDKQLNDKLFSEREEFIRRCVLAAREVIKNGYKLSVPRVSIEAVAE